MRHIRTRLTYANVMSSIAVFLVLGGAAFAATQLPKNSVGTKQLKKNAVNSAKVKNNSLTGADIKLSSLGTVPSATNATHATSADSATNASSAKAAASPQALASGQTETGVYYTITPDNGSTNFFGVQISFTFPLNFTPVKSGAGQNIWYIEIGSTPPSQCPGTADNPQARPGNVCIYENLYTGSGVRFVDGAEPETKYGLGIAAQANADSSYTDFGGRWAATGA